MDITTDLYWANVLVFLVSPRVFLFFLVFVLFLPYFLIDLPRFFCFFWIFSTTVWQILKSTSKNTVEISTFIKNTPKHEGFWTLVSEFAILSHEKTKKKQKKGEVNLSKYQTKKV